MRIILMTIVVLISSMRECLMHPIRYSTSFAQKQYSNVLRKKMKMQVLFSEYNLEKAVTISCLLVNEACSFFQKHLSLFEKEKEIYSIIQKRATCSPGFIVDLYIIFWKIIANYEAFKLKKSQEYIFSRVVGFILNKSKSVSNPEKLNTIIQDLFSIASH